MNKKMIQGYINNFRRRIAKYFKAGIGMTCNVYPIQEGGAILEFTIGTGIENDDIYKETSPSFGQALSKIKQHAFGGNLNGFLFRGTNVVLEGDRIIFIKDGSSKEWDDNAAQQDLQRVLQGQRGA